MVATDFGWDGSAEKVVRFRMAGDTNHNAGASAEITIPVRPAAPTGGLTLAKAKDGITITNAGSFPGCEFSVEGTAWNGTGVFTGLTAGKAYAAQIRAKAAAGTFHSEAVAQTVTTVNTDGSTILKSGESAAIDGTAITNSGNTVTLEKGGTTTAITLPGSGSVAVSGDGTVAVPGGSSVQIGGAAVEISAGTGSVTPSGEVKYSVTFDTQGGPAVASQTVAIDGKAIQPADPARSGYTFGGWYTEAACTTAWSFDSPVNGNMTLYAKWTANSSDGHGGSSTTYPPTVAQPGEGGTVSVAPSKPSTGDKVTVRPKPDTGFEVDQVTVTDKSGRPVTVKKNPDGHLYLHPAQRQSEN